MKSIFNVLGRFARWIFPYNRMGDLLLNYLLFVRAHGRLPVRRLSFNDFLFFKKIDSKFDACLNSFISDKEFVKLFVRAVVGDSYNIKTVAVLRSKAEVEGFNFEPNMVVKPTHASGEVLFTNELNDNSLKKVLSWFDLDYYKKTRERNYKNLERKVIIEPLIYNTKDNVDFKFHCYKGRVRLLHVDYDRHGEHRRAFYDRSLKKLPFSIGYPIFEGKIGFPRNIYEMINVAEKLAVYFDFVRVDMYSDGESFFIGELTNIHGNSHESFFPKSAESIYGQRFFQLDDF